MFDLRQILDHPESPPSWFRLALEHNLGRIAAEPKLQRYFLKAARLPLEADTAWYVPVPVTDVKPLWDGEDRPCDLDAVRAFAHQEEPDLPPHLLMAPVRVHGRLTAVVAAEKIDGAFPLGTGHELSSYCGLLAQEMMTREERQADEVLLRIKEEILRELRPQDLAYRILHGLRQLVDYDHSSALLIYDRAARSLRVEAEQIAWTKAKSRAIDRELPLSPDLAEALRLRGERIVSRRKGRVDAAASVLLDPDGELAEILGYVTSDGAPEPTSTLCAPLVDEGELLGLLRVSVLRRSAFQVWDARVVGRFLPAAVTAIQDAHHRQAQEHQALSAQQRAYLVNVARFVAHDVNNSLGAVLPLAQQLLAEIEEDRVEPETWREDLKEIIRNVDLSRGIFERLLRQDHHPQTQDPRTDVNRVVKDRLALLDPVFTRHEATWSVDLEPRLPRIAMHRERLAHVVWNLVTNALDARTPAGCRVRVTTRRTQDDNGAFQVTLKVADNGCGISEEQQARIFEPFHSTKGSTGLGLPLVQRLVHEAGGTVHLESTLGEGTVVTVTLPALGEESSEP